MAMADTAAMLAPQVTIQVLAITPADTITTQVRKKFIFLNMLQIFFIRNQMPKGNVIFGLLY